MLGSAGGAAECWGGIVGGMLGNAWGMLRNAGECWGVLGAGGMLGECLGKMLGECWVNAGGFWEMLGNAGGMLLSSSFLQCMRVGQLEPQNKNALPVPLLRQVSWRPFFGFFFRVRFWEAS